MAAGRLGAVLSAHVERATAAALQERAERWLAEVSTDGAPRWGWSRATDAAIVLGSAQRLGTWRPPPPYALLRRATGGGAVICDASYLMLDVALPAGDPRVIDDLAESYRWLAEELLARLAAAGAHGLRALAPRELAGRSEADRAAARHACFAGLGPYEIVDAGGRKLVGLAQRRRRGAALFQAAAYLDGDRTSLADILPLGPDAREDLRRRLQRVANLAEVAAGFEPFAPGGAGASTRGR